MSYITAKELATQLGKPTMVDPRLQTCVDSASFQIDDWCGRSEPFPSDAIPATISLVALSLSVDLWKQPDATFGIIGAGENGPVRIARDLVNRYDSLLIPFYEPSNGWGVA